MIEFRVDEENHFFYEISEYLDDSSLKAEIRSKTFTFEEKIDIIRNIMAALKVAHHENVFHRDINPENVFMIGGYAYLGNFGKSYFADESRDGYTVMPTISENNATAYHPLELTIGDASRASDIYSLGVLIYWLFTGQEPVKNPFELNSLSGKLPENRLPSKINPSLPKWLDDLSNKAILADESLRFDSIEELEQFLSKALKENQSSVPSGKVATIPIIETYDLKEGDAFERVYLIQKVLGRGGYSRVFKVHQQLQGESFTLKLFHESVNAQSVIDEYQALKKLDHPNIVKFVGNGKSIDGQFYTIMEYLEGENLGTYTRTDARLPIRRVYQVASNILSALVAMQKLDKPILHRDVKPQNIVWDHEKRFVLIDFNVASFAYDNKDFVGTNPYLAPDLIIDGTKINWDKSADTFALGITLYELICKRYPWSPGKLPLLSKEPISPQIIENRLSDEFAAFILKAINPRSSQRFTDAQQMLDALLLVGEDGILKGHDEIPVKSLQDPPKEDIVKYINSLFSQSRYGNSGTRANFNISAYDEATYTPTKLDNYLIPAVLDGQFKLLIITGNAGDGKTAFIRKIEKSQNVTQLKRFEHKNGARFQINGVPFESNYDGSQDEGNKLNNEVLENFLHPFEHLSNYCSAKEGRIIAINEGRLVEFLKTSSKHHQLHDHIENYFYNEGHHELPEGLMIINLNLRSVTAQEQTESSLFRQQINALTKKELWLKCEGCELANQCFIRYNVASFNDTASGEEVITRVEWLLRTAGLKRELHITMRDLRSLIAFMLTRDKTCKEVKLLYKDNLARPENYWEYYYFNITNPEINDAGNQDRLIKLLRETDVGQVALPDLDRDLFFGKHRNQSYLEFSEREIDLLTAFNEIDRIKATYQQDDTEINKIKKIQQTFVRHQYFEGRAELLNLDSGYSLPGDEQETALPSYLLRLPYHSVFKFEKVLEKGDAENETKTSISRAISLNEGCDNAEIDQDYLVLSSTEIKDPFSKSFRLFNLNDFELFVNRTDHLVKYLEYKPDSLIFRHKVQKHIKLTISLDLYEMLYFIQRGFSPSLNDLRGKFVELIIFKNLLENLTYSEVVVTKDNIEFFKISKSGQSRLSISAMEV